MSRHRLHLAVFFLPPLLVFGFLYFRHYRPLNTIGPTISSLHYDTLYSDFIQPTSPYTTMALRAVKLLETGNDANLTAALYPFLPRPLTMVSEDAGAGVVIPTSTTMLPDTFLLLKSLELLNNTLPIELTYFGDGDLSETSRSLLRHKYPTLRFLDLEPLFPTEQLTSWAIKPFSILASSFAEVILIDSDVIFLQPPETLLKDPSYQQFGTLFFHDRLVFAGNPSHKDWITSILPSHGPSLRLQSSPVWSLETMEEQESGVVLLRKSDLQVFSALLLTTWMNSLSIRENTYSHIYGDKETYWLAFELMSLEYNFWPSHAGGLGQLVDSPPDQRLMTSHLTQMTKDRKPIWFNGGMYKIKARPQDGWFEPGHVMGDDGLWTYRPRWQLAWISGGVVVELDDGVKWLLGELVGEAREAR
jgi:alpha 1,3-mannosyltransferase